MADVVSITVYPREGTTYPDATGTPITSVGAIVYTSKYIRDAIRAGFLLTWDPLGIYQPEDRTGGGSGGGDSLAFDTAAQLGAFLGTVGGQVATTTGCLERGDGGGGQWYWDLGSSTTANVGTVIGASGVGRWKRIYNGPICARWFGATGDGTTDDTTALQRFIDALPVAGEGYIDAGNYRITTGLHVTTNDVRIFGPASRNTNTGARIVWDGVDGSLFAVTFSGMGQIMERVNFNLVQPVRGFVEVGSIDGSTCSNFRLTESFMLGGPDPADPVFQYGVAIGWTNPSANNMEYMTFQDVVVTNAERCGFYCGGNPNALGHVWERCTVTNFMGGVGAKKYVAAGLVDGVTRPYGIGIELVGGNQVSIEDCRFGHLEACVTFINSGDRDFINISNSDMEVCKKLVYGYFANAGKVVLDKCRAPANYLERSSLGPLVFSASDLKYCEISAGAGSVLTLKDCALQKSDGFTTVVNSTVIAPTVYATGCTFPGTQPFATSAYTRVYSFANRGSNGSTGTTEILDGVYQGGGFVNIPVHFDAIQGYSPPKALNAGSVGTMPTSGTPRRNKHGKETISGASTSVVVNFSATESTSTYAVRFAVISYTGTPAAGSFNATSSSQLTTGFTLNLVAAPGVGNSVTVLWEVIDAFGV